MANAEQRRHPRIRRRFQVTIAGRGRSFSGFTGDLSSSGVLVYCTEILQPGTAVTASMKLEGQTVSFGAMVRWSRSASRTNSNETQHSMGLAFLSGPGAAYQEYFTLAAIELGLIAPPELVPVPPPPGEKKPKIAVPQPRPPEKPIVTPPTVPRPSEKASSPLPEAVAHEKPREAAPTPVPVAGLVLGLIGRAEGSTKSSNSKVRGASPIAPSSAALLFEKAAVQAVAGVLPVGTQTLGLSLKLSLNRPPHVMIGARLEAVATLVQIAPDRTLRFQVELREGERLVASGEHQRILVAG
jgi:predicted thioesterase